MRFSRHPFTGTLQVNFGLPLRRDHFNLIHDVNGTTVGRIDPCGLVKDRLDRTVGHYDIFKTEDYCPCCGKLSKLCRCHGHDMR